MSGYNHSFRPYLNETLEVAEIDVEGLKQCLADARQTLKRTPRNTIEYHRQKKHLQILKQRLMTAEACLSRISVLYRELCSLNEDH